MSLTREKVKWLMPPGVRGTAASESDDYEGDDSDEEEEEDEEEALIRRNRRRGRSAQRRSARQARRRSPSDPGVSQTPNLVSDMLFGRVAMSQAYRMSCPYPTMSDL